MSIKVTCKYCGIEGDVYKDNDTVLACTLCVDKLKQINQYLLDACKAIVAAEENTYDMPHADAVIVLKAAVEQCRAAIKKAEG